MSGAAEEQQTTIKDDGTFASVLMRRYCEDDVPEDQVEMYVFSGLDRSGNDRVTPVELVGRSKVLAKISQLHRLEKIALRDSGVLSAGEPGSVGATAPNLLELDIQGNGLRRWSDVASIARELPRLRALNASRMRLSGEAAGGDAASLEGAYGGSMSSLATLVVNECDADWDFMCRMLRVAAPRLEELHARGNGISTLAMPNGPCFETLRVLTLEGNGISDWGEVERLGALPCLEHLGLNKNELSTVRGPADGSFPKLKSLSISHNKIDSWECVDRLGQFPNLTDLRFQVNPITSTVGFSLARQIVIARIATLKSLNGSTVRDRERSDAEKTYLRRCLQEAITEAGEGGTPDPTKGHPRYAALVEKHGAPVVHAGPGGSGNSLDVLSVTIRCVAASQAMSAPVPRRLPGSLTVKNVKLICQQLFKIPPQSQRVFVRGGGGSRAQLGEMPEELLDDSKTIAYYGASNGGEIVIDERDENAAAGATAESDAAAAEKEKKMVAELEAAEKRRQEHRRLVEEAKKAAAAAQQQTK